MQYQSTQNKHSKILLLLIILSLLIYSVFAYDLVRTDYVKLLLLYSTSFLLFYKLVQLAKQSFELLAWTAFAFRLVFILSIPNLSQDFYRFLWDGRLILEGINPYLSTPNQLINSGSESINQAVLLHNEMTDLNTVNFSNYTPFNQLLFFIAAVFSGKSILGSVMVLRLIIIAADLGTLFYGRKLLRLLKKPEHHIFWFILNPLVIIEFTGNLHFEGVMIFFLIWSLYLLHKGYWRWAAIVFGCSVSVKLITLLFIPLFIHYLGWRKWFIFSSIVALITIAFFIPFLSSELITNYSQTLSLYFQKFEFNASIYYLAREVGFLFRGWNEIAIIGKLMASIVFIAVILMAFLRENKSTLQLVTTMMFAISIYFFLSTTVHPWYITTILAISIFTKYRYALVWSFIIALSYLAYAIDQTQENLWIVSLEYSMVYGILVWELVKCHKKKLKLD